MPTVNTPFTYCHLLNLLSAFTLPDVSTPFVLANFAPDLLFTNWKDVVWIIWSATRRTISSVLFCALAAKKVKTNRRMERLFLMVISLCKGLKYRQSSAKS